MAKSWKYGRKRKAFSREDLKVKLSQAVEKLEKIILTSDSEHKVTQAAYALASLVRTHMQIYEHEDLREDVQALRDRLEAIENNQKKG